jgi:hypothetical protein
LQALVARRERWRTELAAVRRLHARLLEAEAILAGRWATTDVEVTNAAVAERFDQWVAQLGAAAAQGLDTELEQTCLAHFLHVTQNLRPQLLQCYDVAGLPRTNNDLEGFIRAIKTRYRRVSGRKNWNRYLLRYGRRVAYYEARVRMDAGTGDVEQGVRRVTHAQWRVARAEQQRCQTEQLKQHRFRHRRTAFLQGLEARWAAAHSRTGVLPERTLPLP